MRKILLPLLGAGALMLGVPAAVAQPDGYGYQTPSQGGPSPGDQHDMHTGAANTNGSSSVAYDRYGAHADGFPKIRLADTGDIEGRAWRHARRRHHHHEQPTTYQ
ncbi:MAG TPA: hypothetical protein VHV27_07965 [Phenylobacterium sp.]|jgi:hypothetical protein|nr:hypothetical protein [Phenylobacterium sp.]